MMNTIRRLAKRYPLIIFFMLAFAIAMPAFALNTAETPVTIQLILLVVGSYAPAVAALAVLDLGEDEPGSKALRKRVWKWRAAVGWYLLVLLLPTGAWLVAGVLGLGLDALRTAQFNQLAFLPIILVTSFGEEIGWRGFALPRMMTRLRPIPASLVLGAIWGLFHVPSYWGRPVVMGLNFALTIGLSILLTWLFLSTGGSIPLCALLHAVFNIWGQLYLSAGESEIVLGVAIAVMWVFTGLLVLRYGMDLVPAPIPAGTDGGSV